MNRVLATAHGELRLPVFLPDATRAVVRAVDSEDLRRCGVEGIVVNAFHLAERPGCRAVKELGGVHRFMGWDGPVLSDSGGYQVWSLLREGTVKGSVSRKGFRWRGAGEGDARLLTPEKAIRRQFDVGADILVCLDHCTHPEAPADEQRESVANTVAWARECREAFDRRAGETGRRPLLFAVVQGGDDPALRRECAARLQEIGFDGYGFGGRPVTEDGRLIDAVGVVAEALPKDVWLWGLGIGKPEHVAACVAMGFTLFDCVLPTRDARKLRLYAFEDAAGTGTAYRHVYLQDGRHARDDGPIDPSCDQPCCRHYSRAWLHHLFAIKDALAPRLATMHNLRFYTRLLDRLRT